MISITFYLGIFSVIASVAQLGIFYWDRTYYAKVYGNLDTKKHLAKSAKVLFLLAPAVGIEPTTN